MHDQNDSFPFSTLHYEWNEGRAGRGQPLVAALPGDARSHDATRGVVHGRLHRCTALSPRRGNNIFSATLTSHCNNVNHVYNNFNHKYIITGKTTELKQLLDLFVQFLNLYFQVYEIMLFVIMFNEWKIFVVERKFLCGEN